MKRFFYLSLILLSLLLAGNLLTFALQFHVIFQPDRLAPDFRFVFDDPFEEVVLYTPYRGRIHGLWFRQDNSRGVVLYFHGNAGALDRWGKIYREQFRDYGYDLIIMDYRQFGKSQGPVSEAAFFGDALAFYDHLASHYSADAIILYGRSMGSGMAAYVAAHRRAAHLVLETPFSSMPDLFYTYYPFLPRLFLFQFRLDNTHWLQRVPFPVTVLAGDADYVTPLRCARKLEPSLKEGDRFVALPGGGHHNLRDLPEFWLEMDRVFGAASNGAD